MRLTALLTLTMALLCGCSGGMSRQGAAAADTAAVDTAFSESQIDALLRRAAGSDTLPQSDYAAMIEQIRGLNRRIAGRLRAASLADRNADSAQAAQLHLEAQLRADTLLGRYQSLSMQLLQLVQNADLDLSNRERYASMMEDAGRELRSIGE